MEPLRNRVEGAVDDIGGEHVRRIRIGIAEEVCEAHCWKRVIIIEEAFVEFHHDLSDGLGLRERPWIDEAIDLRQWLMYEIALKRRVGTCKRRCQLSADDKQQTSQRSEQYRSNASMILDEFVVSKRLRFFALHVGISRTNIDHSSKAYHFHRAIFHVKIPSVSSVC